MSDLGTIRHGVDTSDPFRALEMIAEDLEIIAAAIHRTDEDDPCARAIERAAARMNDALTALGHPTEWARKLSEQPALDVVRALSAQNSRTTEKPDDLPRAGVALGKAPKKTTARRSRRKAA